MSERGEARGGGRGMLRVTALMSSVVDLHVKIALQEADREKRRLVVAGVLVGMGLTFVTFAGVALQLALVLWLHQTFAWSWLHCILAVAGFDLALSGLLLRVGGGMLKGPFLPETLAGISRTTRALTGRF
ncbi:MAG: phage holin family protein [Cyanobium sp.]